MSARAAVLLGLIIFVSGAGLLVIGGFVNADLKIYPLVLGFGGVCLGLSLMLNAAFDWMKGK